MNNELLPNVLIVDDLAENRLALRSLLSGLKARILEANSGEHALDVLLRNEVALVLLDVQMPGMDGFELADIMRGSERTRGVPIVFVTAGAPDSSWEFRGYDAGAVDFLFKPLDPRIVLSKVNVLLAFSQQKRALEDQARTAEAARKHTEYLNSKLEAETVLRDRFVAALSHDLRTPITAARLGAQMIEYQKDKALYYSQKIVNNLDRADRMITDLLDVSRLEAGKPVPLLFEPMDLEAFLHRLGDELKGMYGARIHVESETGLKGVWSEEPLRRLLENLVSNAVKYGHHSAPIQIKASKSKQGARLMVNNKGNPIPQLELNKLFDRFHRTPAAEGGGKRGWGIGLAICQGIVSALGGQIQVNSNQEDGTTFTIDLPKDSRESQNLRVQKASSGGMKILLIDDKEATRFAMKRLLETEKFSVIEAASGTEGIRTFANEGADTVLVSHQLADLDGSEVCRRILAIPTHNAKVAIVHSLEPGTQQLPLGGSGGAHAILSRLTDPAELLQEIHSLANTGKVALIS